MNPPEPRFLFLSIRIPLVATPTLAHNGVRKQYAVKRRAIVAFPPASLNIQHSPARFAPQERSVQGKLVLEGDSYEGIVGADFAGDAGRSCRYSSGGK